MPIVVSTIPSGTLVATLQEYIATDVGLSIAASGAGTVTQATMDILFEKTLLFVNAAVGTEMAVLAGDIDPLPDDDLAALIVMQADCLLFQHNLEKSKNNPEIKRIRVDEIEVEFSDVTTYKSKDLDAKYGFCAIFENAMASYIQEHLVAGAGDIIWQGNTRRWEDVDFDGTGRSTAYNPQPYIGNNPPPGGVNGDDQSGKCRMGE